MTQPSMDDLHITEQTVQYQLEAALCLVEEEQGTFRLYEDGKPRFTPREDPEMQQWLDQYGFLCQYMIELRNGVATPGPGIDFEVVAALTAYVEDAGNAGEVLEYLSERWLPARARVLRNLRKRPASARILEAEEPEMFDRVLLQMLTSWDGLCLVLLAILHCCWLWSKLGLMSPWQAVVWVIR